MAASISKEIAIKDILETMAHYFFISSRT